MSADDSEDDDIRPKFLTISFCLAPFTRIMVYMPCISCSTVIAFNFFWERTQLVLLIVGSPSIREFDIFSALDSKIIAIR